MQYPAVELLTGFAFLACALAWNFTVPSFLNSAFLAAILVLGFIDYQHQILPNVLTISGTAAGILLSPFQTASFYRDVVSYSIAAALFGDDPERILPWVGSIFGAAVGGGLLLVVGYAYKLTRKRQGLGLGDVKMMAMVGAFLGWRLALLTVFFGSFIGSVIGLFLILFRGRNLQHRLAFGTLLGAAAALALFYGLPLINWYTSSRR